MKITRYTQASVRSAERNASSGRIESEKRWREYSRLGRDSLVEGGTMKDKPKDIVFDRECLKCEQYLRKEHPCKGHPRTIKEGQCNCFIERKK